MDVLVALSIFEGRNGAMVSARIKDLRPAGMGEEHAQLAQWADAFCSGAALEEAQRRAITPLTFLTQAH